MPILVICSILMSFIACAEEGKNIQNQFVLVPVEKCMAVKDKQARELCSAHAFPGDVTQYKLVPGSYGKASVRMMSTETDGVELLCYRCSLKKVAQESCGRYKSVWGNEAWVKQCPNHK